MSNGAISICSVELLNCISRRSSFYCGIMALQYLGVINSSSKTMCISLGLDFLQDYEGPKSLDILNFDLKK